MALEKEEIAESRRSHRINRTTYFVPFRTRHIRNLESGLCPVTAWRFVIGSSGGDQEVTLFEVVYAKDVGEMCATAAVAAPKTRTRSA
jgi:hypothetical protein